VNIVIDGVKTNVAITSTQTLKDLLELIQERYQFLFPNHVYVIVDGLEYGLEDLPMDLSQKRLSHVKSLEFITRKESAPAYMDPRELAYQSCEDLRAYCPYIQKMAIQAAEAAGTPGFYGEFLKLIEGIGVFTEAMKGIKTILKLYHSQEISILETDLLSILQDLQATQVSQHIEYAQELLAIHLYDNIQEWFDSGLPKILSIRDC
jgi:hypothetical protein